MATLSVTPIATAAASKVAGLRSLEISTGEVVEQADRIEVASLNTTGTVNVRVTTEDGSAAKVGDVEAPSGTWVTLPVSELAKGKDLALSVADHTYQIATLPADFPDYDVSTNHPTPGIICLSAVAADTSRPNFLMVLDEAGRPLYYKKLAAKPFDFQRCIAPDGSARYTYVEQAGAQVDGVPSPVGTVHLLDEKFQELKTFAVLAHGDHGALPADVHEVVYFDDDHYLVAALAPKTVTNIPSRAGASSGVAAAILQEVQGGQVVWEWDSTHYPAFYDNASDGNDYTNASLKWADYMHFNSIDVDPADNNLIVSFRHQDQVVKLDRKTGEVLWRLGGKDGNIPLTATQQFSHQHFARLHPDGTLTVFDNGNASAVSRLLTFQLDQAAKSISNFDAFAPEPRYSLAMGNLQLLAANTYFVGWGAHPAGYSDATEVTRDGATSFSLTFKDGAYSSYRALKYTL